MQRIVHHHTCGSPIILVLFFVLFPRFFFLLILKTFPLPFFLSRFVLLNSSTPFGGGQNSDEMLRGASRVLDDGAVMRGETCPKSAVPAGDQ